MESTKVADSDPQQVIEATQQWLDKAVIGLNLCPFAGAVRRSGSIRFVCSGAGDEADLLAELQAELQLLAKADPADIETTLLIHPGVLADFFDYNDFLGIADACIESLGLDGEIQIASFHPDYRFDGSEPDDIDNYSNRSPYPMLHLLREASVERALRGVADPDEIYRRNIKTLRRLGHDGWRKLFGR
ncbi:DUF1415 domain-containing protein [Piscinibacter sakaiensis]|uniref:DUF1415 domain-containing protein n=1 Tax=Piscinibacter sakaiensis TaxID=1547922 RepID=UPI003AAF93F1